MAEILVWNKDFHEFPLLAYESDSVDLDFLRIHTTVREEK